MFPKNLIKISKKWVTLIELLLSMTIFSMVMIIVMSSVQSMMASRIKNMNRIALTDELYFFSEQLFTTIKDGGTIDYEEYWNRSAVWTGVVDGYYSKATGLGNYWWWGVFPKNNNSVIASEISNLWKYFYYCYSESPSKYLDGQWCLEKLNTTKINQTWKYQRYGQYELQFIDHNANRDNTDNGTEDDRNLYRWPIAVPQDPKELYLYNSHDNTRTLIRWKKIKDPNVVSGTCANTTPDNCLGTIQILKLQGLDRGSNHNGTGTGAYDGKIDTWICATGWNCQWPKINEWNLATGQDGEWINLFPNTINVRNFQLDVFPKRDPWLAAAQEDCKNTDTNCISPFIHPYVRINFELGFSHGKRRGLKNENPVISLPVTISLDDFR